MHTLLTNKGVLKMEELVQYLPEQAQVVLTIILAILAAFELFKKKQYKDGLYLIMESIGFEKGVNKEIKEKIKEETKKRGSDFIADKVHELKRRNKTVRLLSKLTRPVRNFLF